MTDKTGDVELPELDEMLAEKHSAYMGTVILSPSSKAIYDVAQELRTGLLAALRESRELREQVTTRNKWMHGRFGFVKSADGSGKCACAYCTGDVEALADHAADMEMQLFLDGGWKDRAEKAEAELASARKRIEELER